jgi:glycosyltransferase involved in cell wall biosynthesis
MLRRALESARRQRHKGYDIVVVDDASDTPVVIDREDGPVVTLLRLSHQRGAGGARNAGVANAKGRWIAFLDDDDEYEADFLTSTSARFRAAPDCRFSWSSAMFMNYDRDNRPVGADACLFPEVFESEDKCLKTAVAVGAGFGFTVDRHVFLALGGFDQDYAAIEDTEFFFRLIAAGHRPVVVSNPVVRIHNHQGPRMTAKGSTRQRILECQRLGSRYAEIIGRYPGLHEYLRSMDDALKQRARELEAG